VFAKTYSNTKGVFCFESAAKTTQFALKQLTFFAKQTVETSLKNIVYFCSTKTKQNTCVFFIDMKAKRTN